MGQYRAVAFPLAFLTITAYSFNSQVFVWIGHAEFTSKLFELWICHVGLLIFAPFFVLSGRGFTSEINEYIELGKTRLSFVRGALIAACFQMEIYYLWFATSMLLPTQLLAAIFQSSIAVVYVLSVAFLGETCQRSKVSAVGVAIIGVVLASYSPPHVRSSDNGESSTPGLYPTDGGTVFLGVLMALGANVSNAVYQVWFKHSFGSRSPRFMLFFCVSLGTAHLFPILPMLGLFHKLGWKDARIFMDLKTGQQASLVILAASISACVIIGSLLVIALESPLFWSSFQLLAVPLSVFFDFIIRGLVPKPLGVIGYVLIVSSVAALASRSPRALMEEVNGDIGVFSPVKNEIECSDLVTVEVIGKN
eukprot:TRINITY_DN27286_c0_g1_i1.p1 TRINITY_DN27286_c0_g1~~TRINITY_DN27286_c0_g1_i1.p1  ORF type:complete len:364 (+),score=29.03 TRINITY_DN27286_c0_g1_i1:63-1154(+)